MMFKCSYCKRLRPWSRFFDPDTFLFRGVSSSVGKHNEQGNRSDDVGIRNVGIMAHIDAGKTTTTERMLYYAGFTRRMGDVDSGNTVMDYLHQERERGITINSAAISFHWLKHRINLIDTPGHVDFTFEVERSLRVLDGAVALFDGSAGVEAQTITVWRQAGHHGIPRIAFINKMDKPGASLADSVKSMEDKLHTTPLVTQLPLGVGRNFTGVIDLLTMDLLVWDKGGDGANFTNVPLIAPNPELEHKDFSKLGRLSELSRDAPVSRERIEEALEARYNLAEQVVTLDNDLLEMVADDSFDPLTLRDDQLRPAIRRLTLGQLATPVLCGSSLKNIGVQPLMDAIVEYLPRPEEREVSVPEPLKGLYAYAFKVSYDKRRGHVVYLRVYSGELRPQTTVHNISRNADERITRVLLMLADEQKEVSVMTKGNIAVAVGMKNTYTGDTIVQSATAASAAREQLRGPTDSRHKDKMADTSSSEGNAVLGLGRLEVPPPVFFCSIEPASAAQQKELDHALSCLTREDPSLRVTVNEDTGQTVLSGMGELHLEVIHDRLTRDYGIDCSLGELQVAYREAPTVSVTRVATLDQTIGGKRHTVSLTLNLENDCNHDNKPSVHLKIGKALPGIGYSKQEVVDAITAGVESACLQGPLLAFPVQNVGVSLTSLTLGSATPLSALSSCVSEGVARALRDAHVQLLEPCTELVVTVTEEHLGSVLSDLTSQRRAQVKEVSVATETRVIHALAPLAGLMGYSTTLRTMTSGTGSFMAKFSHYEHVSRDHEKLIIEKIRGYSF